MAGRPELPPTKGKAVDGILREEWGKDKEFSFGYVMLELPIRH